MTQLFRYRQDQVRAFVAAPKCLRDPQSVPPDKPLPFKNYGESGRKLDRDLDLVDGPFLNLRLHIRAGLFADTTTYEAALLLDNQRIRGVGYSSIEVTRWFKIRIPKGWHQNIIDPNVDGDDGNRHEPLPVFAPDGLEAFLHLVACLWNISIPRGGQLL